MNALIQAEFNKALCSYDSLSSEHSKRLADAYTEIGVVFKEAGIPTLEKIAALQAAWFRAHSQREVVVT